MLKEQSHPQVRRAALVLAYTIVKQEQAKALVLKRPLSVSGSGPASTSTSTTTLPHPFPVALYTVMNHSHSPVSPIQQHLADMLNQRGCNTTILSRRQRNRMLLRSVNTNEADLAHDIDCSQVLIIITQTRYWNVANRNRNHYVFPLEYACFTGVPIIFVQLIEHHLDGVTDMELANVENELGRAYGHTMPVLRVKSNCSPADLKELQHSLVGLLEAVAVAAATTASS